MTQIAINDKADENQRLLEYITMEQEKIDLARKGIEEDKERFQKIMDDSKKNLDRVKEELKIAGYEKNNLNKKIAALEADIALKDNSIKKVEDDLIQDKINKHFLDILAIQAGLKEPQEKSQEPSGLNIEE